MILTIWHNVDYDEVNAWSPELADRLPIRTHGQDILAIAMAIVKVVRPDILTNVHKRMAAVLALAKSETRAVKLTELKGSPVQHQQLPTDLLGRIRLIRATLLSVYPHSFEFWVEGFQRDSHPTQNVVEWEHIAAIFHEYLWTTPLAAEQQRLVLAALVGIAADTAPDGAGLPEGAIQHLAGMFRTAVPEIDPPDEVPFRDVGSKELGAELETFFDQHDKERFPKDPPTDIVEQLIDREHVGRRKHGSKRKERG